MTLHFTFPLPPSAVGEGVPGEILPYDPYDWNKGFKFAVHMTDGTMYSSTLENLLPVL
jgi:hypothetical protein